MLTYFLITQFSLVVEWYSVLEKVVKNFCLSEYANAGFNFK